jgi:catechol 2,3-dioxygenase-like lactoylglutathione lyase family enzyme
MVAGMKSAILLSAGLLVGFGAGVHQAQEREVVSLNHVAISVDEYDEAVAFYSETLGFPVAFEFDESDGFAMSYVQINRNTFIEVIPSSPERPAGFVHIGLEVSDAAALVDRLSESGIRTRGPGLSPRTGTTIGLAQAPDGTTIELLEFGPGSLHRSVMEAWR